MFVLFQCVTFLQLGDEKSPFVCGFNFSQVCLFFSVYICLFQHVNHVACRAECIPLTMPRPTPSHCLQDIKSLERVTFNCFKTVYALFVFLLLFVLCFCFSHEGLKCWRVRQAHTKLIRNPQKKQNKSF